MVQQKCAKVLQGDKGFLRGTKAVDKEEVMEFAYALLSSLILNLSDNVSSQMDEETQLPNMIEI